MHMILFINKGGKEGGHNYLPMGIQCLARYDTQYVPAICICNAVGGNGRKVCGAQLGLIREQTPSILCKRARDYCASAAGGTHLAETRSRCKG